MSMKKILCGLLAATMLTVSLTACAISSDNGKESDTETETIVDPGPTEETVDLPEDPYNGEKIVFITRDCNEWSSTDIYSAGGGESTISDAVLERNELVRQRLGIEIQQVPSSNADTKTSVQQAISGGLSDFHAVVSSSQIAAQMANSGWLRDLKSSTINYLDLTKSWWDSNLADELSVGGHLYFATGDMMIMDNDATFCLLFNKTIQEDFKIPSLYDTVEDGEWTLAKMHEYVDLTSSNSEGKDMLYGLLRTADTPFALYYGAGVRAVTKDTKDDTFNYTLDVGRADNVADKAKLIFSNSNSYNITDEWSRTGEDVASLGQKYFGGGQAFLYGDVLQCVERMRAYDIDFGVLPYPMYDTNQPSYYHMMHLEGSVVSIPRSSSLRGDKLDMVTATLEAMAYYSPDTLTEQYYEINLTSKYIDDPESAPMIDIVLETRVYDLPYYYDLTPGQNNVTHTLAQCMLPTSNKKVASATGSIGGLLERKILQLITDMDAHSQKYGE